MDTKGLRNAAIASFFVSMAILLGGGYYAGYFGDGTDGKMPPVPKRVVVVSDDGVSDDGAEEVLTDYDRIMAGQAVYQRYGLMDHGSVWGHGALRGPDFAAATLHRTAEEIRAYLAKQHDLPPDIAELRTNRYDAASGTLRLTPAQAFALKSNRDYWSGLFEQGEKKYGFLPGTVPTPEARKNLADFFFWTAWAAGTERIGPDGESLGYSYTNNWPADRSVGNSASTEAFVWSILSILALFAVLGIVIYVTHRYEFFYGDAKAVEASYRLLELPVTPSQRASAKFFLVAGLLFLLQIFNGGLLAHYTVHPGSFFVEAIGHTYAFSWAKSWHLQLAILWIATSWMGTAIYVAPLVAGRELKGQGLLVNILFGAVVAVTVGSLAGEVLGIKGFFNSEHLWFGEPLWFWLGHQGWEYLELGRLWQILLFGGLIYWVVIVYRAMVPALTGKSDDPDRRSLVKFYVCSAIFVVAFFGFGLLYDPTTHLTIADYWRWFVVHIWVESIFEFFGVAVISLFLVTLGLVTAKSALRVAYLTAILVFLAGIPGTAHHFYWFGGPSYWLAIGGVFSSLEPIPLILLVVRAWKEYKSIRAEGKDFPYRWPLYFLTASSVWNFVGASIFGFIINLPIINYYEHGTYLTSNHAHTALFGVYGMLAIALILFSWRGLVKNEHWNDKILCLSFWGLNLGLLLMFSTGLFPIGIMQVWWSYDQGLWAARSADFYNTQFVQTLGTWRAVPDTIIIVLGACPLLYFLISTFPHLRQASDTSQSEV